jgi:hypothetical protein
MDTVKGFLAPLGLNTGSIQDTLVCVFRTCTPLNRLSHDFSETGSHRRYSRDCSEGLHLRMEWLRGLFVSPLKFIICWLKQKALAFYLTAHFSQEDYPYDWYVRFIGLAVRGALIPSDRLMHWLSKVRSVRKQYSSSAIVTEFAVTSREKSNPRGAAVESLRSARVPSAGIN